MDSPTAFYPACRVNTFEPNDRASVGVQDPSTQVSVTLMSSKGPITLTSRNFDCSNACAVSIRSSYENRYLNT